MPDIIDAIKAALPAGCQAPQCRKGSCSLSMKDAPTNRVLIDLDSDDAPVRRNQERCDYIFVAQANDTRVAALELKGGKLDASEVVRQLRAGARLAERIVPADAPVRFAAIAVHGWRWDTPEGTRRFGLAEQRPTPIIGIGHSPPP